MHGRWLVTLAREQDNESLHLASSSRGKQWDASVHLLVSVKVQRPRQNQKHQYEQRKGGLDLAEQEQDLS